MSSSVQVLTARATRTVEGLCDAAVEELRVSGYEGLTVRNVAKRAGVAPATAYTYFASKEHLVTDAFWRRLSALPGPSIDARRSVRARVRRALDDFATLAKAEPELLAATTIAMIADDPDVKHLRDRVGADIHRRLVAALGRDATPRILTALDLAMSGAMIRAGTGHLSYQDIPEQIAEIAEALL